MRIIQEIKRLSGDTNYYVDMDIAEMETYKGKGGSPGVKYYGKHGGNQFDSIDRFKIATEKHEAALSTLDVQLDALHDEINRLSARRRKLLSAAWDAGVSNSAKLKRLANKNK